ncbi:EGF-like repeat and discoidin I-like domain-containing protein 3 [Amphiura filiformis]|uniref:EGF-like repeat and discoidin I-like domain-containing protein 3 n=1 Tax=Amphiura filiformis TaxID=82378 RepID=UPI003B219C84
METILDSANENDDDIGDNLFITPTATRVNDICPPNFCSNGGTCISDTEAVTGFCLCPDGFGGIDCTDIVPVDGGDGDNVTEICPVDFCQNGGTCLPDPTTNVSTCQCASQFIGSRCETSLEDVDNDVILAMIFIVDALMMVAIIIAISLICYCVARRKRMQHRRISFQPVDTPWSIAVRNRTDGLY